MNKYSKIINSVSYNNASKEDIIDALEVYADHNVKTISTKDYNSIFMLSTIKIEYLRDEIIKRLSKKTIINVFSFLII